ncbi:Trypsin-like peptidase domain-containing protein [Rhizobiales bacterium GAS191]|nr:Trypsin-like peptidase domain-containing protein [Rhizobiales bacterium GAS191]
MPKGHISILACICLLSTAPTSAFSPKEVSQRIAPSVAYIHVIADSKQLNGGLTLQNVSGQWSGIVVDQEKGYILTRCGILQLAGSDVRITVGFGQDAPPSREMDAKLVRCDKFHDLALLQVFGWWTIPPGLRFVDRELKGLEEIYLVGFNGTLLVIPGVIDWPPDRSPPGPLTGVMRVRSRLDPSTPTSINVEDMLHDMSEMAGGPVIDSSGHLVGMIAYASEGEFATIPQQLGLGHQSVPKGTYYIQGGQEVGTRLLALIDGK